MEILHKFITVLIITALVLSLSSCSSKEAGIKSLEAEAHRKYSLEELRVDFNDFRKFIEEKHPKLYTADAELTALFDAQYSQLRDNMGELEFYRTLSPIVSALGCGHTNLVVSEKYESYLKQEGRYLPFYIRVVDDRLYVFKNLSSSEIPEGILIENLPFKKKWIAVAYSTLLFIAGRPLMWGVFSVTGGSLIILLPLTIISVLWSIIYLKTKSLWWCIISHFLIDTLALTAAMLLNLYM